MDEFTINEALRLHSIEVCPTDSRSKLDIALALGAGALITDGDETKFIILETHTNTINQ